MREIKILVTGGGSSGHISPALAIIKTIVAEGGESRQWTPRFLYVGGKRGLEQEQVEAEGIPFVGVETGKLRRYFSRQNFSDALRVPVGIGQAFGIVRRFRPDVVLATGGYVAVPPVLAAAARRVPIVTHEQTVQIGLANRINARFATKIALSFASALEELSPSLRRKAFVSGNPVRPQIFGGDASKAIAFCDFDEQDDLPTIYVTGGSQGARILNRAVEEILPQLLGRCRVIHQCGHQSNDPDFERLLHAQSTLEPRLKRRYSVARFIRDELRDVFALSHLVVGRAGAGTVTELCALGKAAIYVPLVPTGGDEQTRNAQMVEAAGAAYIIRQNELSGAKLLETITSLLNDAPQLQEMGQAAQTLARPDAARDLAHAVVELALKN